MLSLRILRAWRVQMNTRVLLLSATMAALTSGAVAQSDIGPEHSPYYGLPMARPAQLAGLWETSAGNGGAIGMDIMLVTGIRNPRDSFNGTDQVLHSLD